MIQNYLKVALRNLLRNKTFSLINLAGLTLGAACCLYILLYVKDQFGYDRHHTASARLYRVVSDLSGLGDKALETATVSPPIVPAMARDFGEVEAWTRVVDPPEVSHHLLRYENRSFFETRALYVDSTFFKVFDYRFTAGSPERCLDEPYTVVLTAPVASKLFGSEDPVGKSVVIDNRYGNNPFRVTGVVDGSLGKSHIDARFFVSMNSGGIGEYVRQNNQFAGQNFIFGYVKMLPNTQAAALEAKLPAFIEKYGGQQLRELGMNKVLHLEPVTSIHTGSRRENQLSPTVSARFLYVLLTIAGFIQLIACINFMNLTTARSTRRAREVGVRKVMGAQRGMLVRQFLNESLLLAGIAMVLAAPLVWIAMPWLRQLTGVDVEFSFRNNYAILGMIAGLVALTGLVAGSYPAFYLSGFQPVRVLKGLLGSRLSAAMLRRGLVVTQFGIAIVLMVGTVVIKRQLDYIRNKDLGFNKEQKVVVPFRTQEGRQQLAAFNRALREQSEITGVGATRTYPGLPLLQDFGLYPKGKTMDEAEDVLFTTCDEHYVPLLQIPLLEGRQFTPADTSNQLILNEIAIKRFGFTPSGAIGQQVFSEFDGTREAFEIIGVVKNYHQASLYRDIEPSGFMYGPENRLFNSVIAVKTADYSTILPKIEAAWQRYMPGLPFEYSFLDDNIQKQYESDFTLARIINLFTMIAFLISCLGLFGLSAFMAEQRVKEIGIRKVLGATAAGLAGLMARDFLKPVLVALCVAAPVAWFIMQAWLKDFAFRTDLSWWIFAIAGAVAVAVALLTVGFQSVKAALVNPVKSLRSE